MKAVSVGGWRLSGLRLTGTARVRTPLGEPFPQPQPQPEPSVRGFLRGLGLLAIVYLGLAAVLPPADDELYYWCWSRELQASYFDHPPMTAYLIRASTELFGHSLFAIRLPACLTSLTVLAVLGWLTRPRSLLVGVALTPPFTYGGVLITPDTPLLLFWSGYLLWLTVVHGRLARPRNQARVPLWLWFVGGLILGAGGLSKYTMALAVPAGFLSFLLAGRPRTWVGGYLLHGAISFLVALPVFLFNAAHDFAPFQFQIAHASVPATGSGLVSFGKFFGLQLLLFGLLPLLLFPWVLRHRRTLAADPRLRVCACLYAVPYGFFLIKAFHGPLEGNWALASYLGFWPLAAYWYDRVQTSPRYRRLVLASFALPLAAIALLTVHLLLPLPFLRPGQDRISRQAAKVEVTRQAAAAVRDRGIAAPVFAPSYQLTAHLRFQGVEAHQIDGATRPSHFTLGHPPLPSTEQAYVFIQGPLPPPVPPGFEPPEVVGSFPLLVRGETLGYYHLLLYSRTKRAPGMPTESAEGVR